MMDEALLIARLFLGLGLAVHGAQKLFGWYGGGGVNKTGEFFVQLRIAEVLLDGNRGGSDHSADQRDAETASQTRHILNG